MDRLCRLAAELKADGVHLEMATDLEQFSVEADLVICAASLASPSLLLGRIAPHAIVCDAGYPNFHGILNRHPFPDVVHGCLLEGMALALERRFEPFSQGRGFITRERVEQMETIAGRHGFISHRFTAPKDRWGRFRAHRFQSEAEKGKEPLAHARGSESTVSG